MTQQPVAGEREDYKRRMEISQEFWQLNHERAKEAEAALAAAAEQLRAVMAANEILRKQLSDQDHKIGVLKGKAEMWQQRAEIAEAKLNQGGRP